jgi:hypothetical protein
MVALAEVMPVVPAVEEAAAEEAVEMQPHRKLAVTAATVVVIRLRVL